MSSEIRIFKLNYSGGIDEILPEELLRNLTLFNILTFYIPNLKRLYIWIGKKASQNLKSQIPQIRTNITQEYPELQIIRNITVESGLEPPEFLEIVGIEENVLSFSIKALETKLLPILSEISKLKSKADKLFISDDYVGAISVAQDIVKLAKSINDDSLEQDQNNFIEEAKSRAIASEVVQEIKVQYKQALKEFEDLVKKEQFRNAHKLVENLKKKYENKYNLLKLPIAQQLILKDENLVYRLKIEQDSLLKEIEIFSKLSEPSANKYNLREIKEFLARIENMDQRFVNGKIPIKLEQIKNRYYEIKNDLINEVSQLSGVAIRNMERGELWRAIDIFETIIRKLEFTESSEKV
jgi:predicted metal-dependent hydrolase